MTYTKYAQNRNRLENNTPQDQPIKGREDEMVKMRSGGYGFKVGDWDRLNRFLILGTDKTSYYAGEFELTDSNLDLLDGLVQEDPIKVAGMIEDASVNGKSINNSAPIVALVRLSMGEDPRAKTAARSLHDKVIRTASHFYEWLSYVRNMRGFGATIQKAGSAWLNKDEKWLAHQLLKYQSRYGYSNVDVLRLFHPYPSTDARQGLFSWVKNGWAELPDNLNEEQREVFNQIYWYEWLKRNPSGTAEAIKNGRLTREMVKIGDSTPESNQLLFEQMPVGALLRNLGSMTAHEIISPTNSRNLDLIDEKLGTKKSLNKARIHPMDIMKAIKTYENGRGIRGKMSWSPVGRVMDTLDRALDLSFESIEPTGAFFQHYIDISGSMRGWDLSPGKLTSHEAATIIALASIKSETNYGAEGFDYTMHSLGLSRQDNFTSALQKTNKDGGGTDANVAAEHLHSIPGKVDVVVFHTDNESWAGCGGSYGGHVTQTLERYRKTKNPDLQAIFVAYEANEYSLADATESKDWNLAGLHPNIPKIIQMIASGDLQP